MLDTNVVVSAMLWGGRPKLLLQARHEKRIEIYTSTPMLAELTDILSRGKFEKKIAASLLTVDQLVDRYAELAQVVRPTPTPRIVSDPDDDVLQKIASSHARRRNVLRKPRKESHSETARPTTARLPALQKISSTT